MLSKMMPSIPIRYAIPGLLVTLIVLAVGATGWLAFSSGRQAVDELARPLSREISARIEEYVTGYLSPPTLYNRMNAAAINTGSVDATDFDALQALFWRQAQMADGPTSIYFGTEQGELLGINRLEPGVYELWRMDATTGFVWEFVRLDDDGQPVAVTDTIAEFDPRTRPWYRAAQEAGGPVWSEVYAFATEGAALGISPAIPVYGPDGALQGVLSIDITLANLSVFLRDLSISEGGQAFIMERDGAMIATSTAESPFIQAGDEQQRLQATASQAPLIRDTARQLVARYGDLGSLQAGDDFIYERDGQRHYVQVRTVQAHGLDWLVVVVIPEEDLMGPVYDNVRSTLLLGGLVLALAVLMGLVLGSWIFRPIAAITDAAAAIESDTFTPDTLDDVATRTDELGRLARVFQRMAREVHARQEKLKRQVEQLRIDIDAARRQEQVKKIVETDFFRDLQAKAQAMREQMHQTERDIAELSRFSEGVTPPEDDDEDTDTDDPPGGED